MKILGISMRVVQAPDGKDVYDALSQDWGRFFAALGVPWIMLPNREQESVALAKHLDLTAIIFSGGGDVGEHSARDATEMALLHWAQDTHKPIIGICRGFQFLQCALGGALTPYGAQEHVAQRHIIDFKNFSDFPLPAREVNSYHKYAITTLAPGLKTLALCRQDQTIEAAFAPRILGLMWHPEREPLPNQQDLRLLHHFLTA